MDLLRRNREELSLEGVRILGEPFVNSPQMKESIALWCEVYENDAPWSQGERVKNLNLLSAISGEVARLATLELEWKVEGSPRASFLGEQLNSLKKGLRQYLEYAVGKGGLVLKPYLSGGKILIEPIQVERFFPLATGEDGQIISAAFVEQVHEGKTVYTRVEEHSMTDCGVLIQNRAYVAINGNFLAKEVPLSRVAAWSGLEPISLLQGRNQPVFVYLKMPFGNVIEPTSPLGVSIAARSMDFLEEADRQYSRLLWEYEGGELAVDADSTYLTSGGRMPQTTRRLFRSLNTGSDFYHVYNPAFRDESLRAGLNEILRRIEFACGLSYGIISDPGQKELTATEIISAKQRLYSTVREIQKTLQIALDELLDVMNYWADLLPNAPAGGYIATYQWDDSIVSDVFNEKAQFLQEISAGVRKPWEFRVRFLGESEEQAKQSCQVAEQLGI